MSVDPQVSDSNNSVKISLNQQIASVERELAMRRRVYPGLTLRKKMTYARAAFEIAAMEAVRATLQSLRESAEL